MDNRVVNNSAVSRCYAQTRTHRLRRPGNHIIGDENRIRRMRNVVINIYCYEKERRRWGRRCGVLDIVLFHMACGKNPDSDSHIGSISTCKIDEIAPHSYVNSSYSNPNSYRIPCSRDSEMTGEDLVILDRICPTHLTRIIERNGDCSSQPGQCVAANHSIGDEIVTLYPVVGAHVCIESIIGIAHKL